MRKLHAALLAAAGLALAAGGAHAAGKLNTTNVALPDGSVAQITYQGEVAPTIAVVPVEARTYDPFAEMERMSAMMRARHEAMMRQAAEMQYRVQQQILAEQQQTPADRSQGPGRLVVSTNAPAGSYSYTVVSTTTTAGNGCTQTVEYRSDGSGAEPKVTRTSAGDCSAVKRNAPAIPAATPPAKAVPTVPAAAPVQGQARLPSRST